METVRGKTVVRLIVEVSEDICDNFCKYRETVDEECEWMRQGNTCPLDKLY